ncbi:MAG: hypothetical protein ABEJ28_10055, partial [Salinigranum sp.]
MPLGIDVFRYQHPFGKPVIVGLSWDVLLVFAAIAALVFLVHFIVRDLLNPTEHSEPEGGDESVVRTLESRGVDEVNRFTAAQRASHWIMAISIFALMLSGFVI